MKIYIGRSYHNIPPIALIIVFLLLCATFLHLPDIEKIRHPRSFYFPFELREISSILIFSSFILFSLLSILLLLRKKIRINRLILLSSLFYFPIALVSVFTMTETSRYVGIFSFSLFVPLFYIWAIRKYDYVEIIRFLRIGILLILLLGSVFSMLNLWNQPRIAGYVANPNTYGFILFAMAVIYFSGYGVKGIADQIVLMLFTLQAMLTGSRLAWLGFLVFFAFLWWSQRGFRSKINYILFFVGLLLIISLFDLGEYTNRVFNIWTSVEDSGRDDIWLQVIPDIQKNWLLGLGMSGFEERYGTENLHNSYLRVAIMIGVPLAAVVFGLMLLTIITVLLTPLSHPVLKSYFIFLPLLMFGEDYIAGIGSFFFFANSLILALVIISKRVAYRPQLNMCISPSSGFKMMGMF